MVNDLKLVRNIQNDIDVDNSLNELFCLHSGLVFSQIHKTILPNISGIYKQDILDEAPLYVYNAAKTYDENKGCKFSTWLATKTFWDLNQTKKEARQIIPPEEDEDQSFKLQLENEMIEEIFNWLRKNTDSLTVKVFELRFLEPTNGKLLGWCEIGKELGISHEWARLTYKTGLERIKEEFCGK